MLSTRIIELNSKTGWYGLYMPGWRNSYNTSLVCSGDFDSIIAARETLNESGIAAAQMFDGERIALDG